MAIHLYYYKNASGDIQLPPNDETYFTVCPPGYDRFEANTLDEVDRLQKELQAATYRRCQQEQMRDEVAFQESRKRVVDSLNAKLASAATTEYEKEFIRLYIQLRDEKREAYKKRFACDTAYLELRENDKPRNAEETLQESL